jgi:uncharacterized protein YndB with AHSA1/START domain
MPGIHQALLIGAPAEEVYNALTTQQGLAGWWTPEAIAIPEINTIARFPFGPNYSKEMKVVELKPSQLIKWSCIAGADEWVGTSISFQLLVGNSESFSLSHPEMTGQLQQTSRTRLTLLLFQHDDWRKDTLMFAECSYTWGQFLRSLKLLCETGKGRPWPLQHEI